MATPEVQEQLNTTGKARGIQKARGIHLQTAHFMIHDNNGNEVSRPQPAFVVPGLILVTHDESTFYENDCRKTKWVYVTEKVTTEKKGEGQSIMASDFLTTEWGWLTDGDK